MTRAQWILALTLATVLPAGALLAQAPPAVPHPPAGHEISGVVTGEKSGKPIAGASVRLIDTHTRKEAAQTVADEEGHFRFTDVRNGKYDLAASRQGYIAASYQQHPPGVSTAVVTGEGLLTTGLRLVLQEEGSISGTITEDSGDPVANAQVMLFRPDPARGTGKMMRAGGTNADAVGDYELAHLHPGVYYLCVTGSPWYVWQPPANEKNAPRSPLNVAYEVTCHPGVTDSSEAEPIQLNPGDHISIPISMHPVPAVHVSVQLPPPGQGRGATFPQLHTELFGLSEPLPPGGLLNMNQGENGVATAEFLSLAPGHYELVNQNSSGEGNQVATLDASGDQASLDMTNSPRLADVSGKLVMAGGAPIPPHTMVVLRGTQGDNTYNSTVADDGSFTFQGVRPGDYQVHATHFPNAMTVARISSGQRTTRGPMITVASDPLSLTVWADDTSATLSGLATANGKPLSGAFILLVPADPREDPQPNQSDSDGTFDFQQIPAGRYTAVAIEDGWTLEWRRREALLPYLAHGVKVVIPENARDVRLPEPLEIQPK